MGAMPADRLTGPRDLGFTPRVEKVLRALDNDGKMRMLDQLLDAFAEAREKDDLTPINDVIETWYRSMLFVAEGGEGFVEEFQDGFRQIVEGEGGATLDEVRRRLNLDPTKRPPRS
ncbi:MAG: hypothetical protein M3279_10040 [Actinomycetota bacterium]|nr:hypothetical protein [Actinomycetota bacterium]